jgi:hypothetical protein
MKKSELKALIKECIDESTSEPMSFDKLVNKIKSGNKEQEEKNYRIDLDDNNQKFISLHDEVDLKTTPKGFKYLAMRYREYEETTLDLYMEMPKNLDEWHHIVEISRIIK